MLKLSPFYFLFLAQSSACNSTKYYEMLVLHFYSAEYRKFETFERWCYRRIGAPKLSVDGGSNND